MKKLFLILIILASGCSSQQTLKSENSQNGQEIHSENSEYVGKGESIIINNDIPTAKNKALLEAFKSSIQKAVGVYVKTQSKVENFEMTYDKIMGESEGYITDYKIIKEKKDDNIYYVEIEAEVSSEKVESAFNQRLSKYISENLFGPKGSIDLKIYNYSFKPVIYKLIFSCPINDPTIDTKSVSIKLPKSGWLKPQIFEYGITKSIRIVSKNEEIDRRNFKLDYSQDLMIILDKNLEVEVKFKNPNNNKEEVRKIKFEIITANISDHYLDSDEQAYININQKNYYDIDKELITKIMKYLTQADRHFIQIPTLKEIEENDAKYKRHEFETINKGEKSKW